MSVCLPLVRSLFLYVVMYAFRYVFRYLVRPFFMEFSRSLFSQWFRYFSM